MSKSATVRYLTGSIQLVSLFFASSLSYWQERLRNFWTKKSYEPRRVVMNFGLLPSRRNACTRLEKFERATRLLVQPYCVIRRLFHSGSKELKWSSFHCNSFSLYPTTFNRRARSCRGHRFATQTKMVHGSRLKDFTQHLYLNFDYNCYKASFTQWIDTMGDPCWRHCLHFCSFA